MKEISCHKFPVFNFPFHCMAKELYIPCLRQIGFFSFLNEPLSDPLTYSGIIRQEIHQSIFIQMQKILIDPKSSYPIINGTNHSGIGFFFFIIDIGKRSKYS
jgi:hypothetical protein